MPLFLTEEQTMLRDTAKGFVADTAPVAHMRALRDSNDPAGISRDVWKRFAELGFTGIVVPEGDGGLGLGHVEAGIVLEEIGRNLCPSPFLSTAVSAVEALKGTAHAARWYPGILSGDIIAALAVDERAKFTGEVSLRAERSGAGFRLSGAKVFVAHAHVADLLIVAARTSGSASDPSGITLFALERGCPGVVIRPERLVDAGFASTIDFDDVMVGADTVIGEVDAGGAVLAHVLSASRTAAAAEMLGVGDGAMEMTLAYLRTRQQFGVPIGSFQALQHRAAHLYSEMEVARASVLKAQQLLDAEDPQSDTAALIAKAMTGSAAQLAVQEGVQLHGGIGMTDEYDIGLYMKRARVLAEAFGDTAWAADELAKLQGY